MKIAMVAPPWIKIPPEKYGGIEIVVSLLCEGLVKRGHSVTLYSIGDSITEARLSGFYKEEKRSYLDMQPSDMINVLCTHTLACYREIARENFDVIHDHTWKEGLLCADFIDIPVVHTLHAPFIEGNKEFYGLFVKENKKNIHFVTISDFQQKCFPGLNYAGTVYNGILFDKYPYSEKKDDFLFFIGRFNNEKTPHLACEAARKLGLKLILAGKVHEEEERNYFDEYIKPYLGKDIQFIGEIGHWSKEKMDMFSKGKGYLYPISWDEPFGITMVEAMACGTPVLTFERGSTPELVEHGVTGFVVKTMDEFMEYVKRLGEIEPQKCRDIVKKKFTSETMVEGYQEIYRKITGKR